MPPVPPQPQAVLDYASPRQRGKLRLPSESVLAVKQDRDGVTVVEALAGKGQAIFAIGFAAFTLVTMAAVFVSEVDLGSRRHRSDMAGPAFLAASVWLGGVAVMLLVINNTWRRTVLRAHADGVSLEFASPFGRRRYRWPAEQVEGVRVERTSEAAHTLLAELQIHPAGAPPVHLFTDHAETELVGVGHAIRAALGHAVDEPAPSPLSGVALLRSKLGR